MQRIDNPFSVYQDARGLLLDGGYIYVGVPDGDPENVPGDRIEVFSDPGLTIPLAQPIRTVGGLPADGVTPVFLFIDETDFSMIVTDNVGAQVGYSPSVYTDSSSFQPANATLTLLAALTTTAFGRGLLTLADLNALKAALGGLSYLPLAGGTVAGEITHQGAGVVPHWDHADMVEGKMSFTDSAGTDPTDAIGDIWFKGLV